jgi:hypothetical protein
LANPNIFGKSLGSLLAIGDGLCERIRNGMKNGDKITSLNLIVAVVI